MLIATEYIEGETLREEIRRGPVAPERALETVSRPGGCVSRRRTMRGVIHRDLKPENVMRPADRRPEDPRLRPGADARGWRDAARLTADGRVIGTPAYMAPEQIRGDRCDARTDIFSFGIVMFELLDGNASLWRRRFVLDDRQDPRNGTGFSRGGRARRRRPAGRRAVDDRPHLSRQASRGSLRLRAGFARLARTRAIGEARPASHPDWRRPWRRCVGGSSIRPPPVSPTRC